MEMTLDFVYFSSLRKFIKKLDREDREIIEEVNGIYSDLLNLQWILRGKKYYHLSPEVLLNYTIYDGYKLNRDIIKELCYTKSIDEFYGILGTLPYKGIFEDSKQRDYLMERDILTYLKNVFLKYKNENKFNIATVVSYLELALFELRDVISIVENKRYNMENEETKRYITATL
jgi:V/A-type H+-transporting ATPase subunit C